MALSGVIEVKEYEEIVGHPNSPPVLRRSSSAESVNDVSTFQEPMIEVEEEFAPTSRPTLRYTEPELAEQTQVPRKVRVATVTLLEVLHSFYQPYMLCSVVMLPDSSRCYGNQCAEVERNNYANGVGYPNIHRPSMQF